MTDPRSRWALRALLLTTIALSGVAVVGSFVASGVATPGGPVAVDERFDAASERQLPGESWSADRVDAATDDRGVTVVATQGFSISDERAELAAFLPNGTVLHYEDRYRSYFDVDPVGGRYTVEFVAAEHRTGEDCPAGAERCTRNVVVRANLTSGARETVYAETTPRIHNSRWHDVDRLDDTHLLIADIAGDSVYAVDTRTGDVAWRWEAESRWNRSVGGPPTDWTHINDVELLPDGRVMVSVRNMDSVIFLSVENGTATLDRTWTLGAEDDYGTLFEQHNPDYIPADRGGPAVVVADSENTRVEEFRRTGDGWEGTWHWRDARLQWPRDADRLPDGATLVTDSHGDRVVEVGPGGRARWSAHVALPYEAERLGTGAESAGGRATAGGGRATDLPTDRLWMTAKDLVPPVATNSLLYLAPTWVRFSDLAFAALFMSGGLVWGVCELYWSRYTLRGVAGEGAVFARTIGRRLL